MHTATEHKRKCVRCPRSSVPSVYIKIAANCTAAPAPHLTTRLGPSPSCRGCALSDSPDPNAALFSASTSPFCHHRHPCDGITDRLDTAAMECGERPAVRGRTWCHSHGPLAVASVSRRRRKGHNGTRCTVVPCTYIYINLSYLLATNIYGAPAPAGQRPDSGGLRHRRWKRADVFVYR
ncbi:hypothetical protein FA95DRAFT_625912 [Auriscalpium vulgare]|uniref:Uncharacterized protein n=1 Tax=Auriscalpium vulgare TaxID=40419 RepID=A0ACB8REH6_9AGAM|nr:hypothetical protein FA95DRAFT_625912 [Auriscalpium vulgare]